MSSISFFWAVVLLIVLLYYFIDMKICLTNHASAAHAADIDVKNKSQLQYALHTSECATVERHIQAFVYLFHRVNDSRLLRCAESGAIIGKD
jgi:fatty-acid desaturase